MPRTPTRATRRRLAAVALPVVLSVSLSGCLLTAEDDPEAQPSPTLSAKPLPSPTESESEDAAAGLERYYTQDVDWSGCRQKLECAEIQVPLDYEKPDGETITLSLLKVPAAGKGQRVGSLVVNPGGPGGSGIEYAARASTHFGTELRQAFDIVGFDPRGVGESTPIDCLPDEKLDAFVASDPDPETPQEVEQADAMVREFGEGCVEESGDLASHVSTVEAARDIDIIRGLLGDRRLSWFGASYGTFLGATYADLFPERVGRMVLDGARWGPLGMPVVDVVPLRLGVDHALEAGQVAGVGAHGDAVEKVEVPPGLVELGVVGVVAGLDGKGERSTGDRSHPHPVDRVHHRLGDVGGEHLLGAVGRRGDARTDLVVVVAVEVLHAQRRLHVHDVHVGQVREGEQGTPPRGTPPARRDAEVGAHHMRFAGSVDDRGVAAVARSTAQKRAVEGRARRSGEPRGGPGRRTRSQQGRATECRGARERGTRAQEVPSGQVHDRSTIGALGRHAGSYAQAL